MGRLDVFNAPQAAQNIRPIRLIDIYVERKFNDFEVASVAQVLTLANEVDPDAEFSWRYVSYNPGLITGSGGMIVRAEPVVDNHSLPDAMIVVGGERLTERPWLQRMRQMTRLSRSVALLSDAATQYLLATKAPSGRVTTHWRDAQILKEAGHHPHMTLHLSEKSDGVITAAGMGSTAEVVLGLIGYQLGPSAVTEIANRLLLPIVRKSHADQIEGAAQLQSVYDTRIRDAVALMEETLDTPMNIAEITEATGISARHFERLFKEEYGVSPARFYKQMRVKRARMMIEETRIALVDIAVATGFLSSAALSKAVKQEYGVSPTKMRAGSVAKVLAFHA